MKKAEMNVVKFGASDVIATSIYTAQVGGFWDGDAATSGTIEYNGTVYNTAADITSAVQSAGVTDSTVYFTTNGKTNLTVGSIFNADANNTKTNGAVNGIYTWDATAGVFKKQ